MNWKTPVLFLLSLWAFGCGQSGDYDYRVMINYELGMHCTGFEFEYCCILPPYNSIQAQVVKVGVGKSRPRLLEATDPKEPDVLVDPEGTVVGRKDGSAAVMDLARVDPAVPRGAVVEPLDSANRNVPPDGTVIPPLSEVLHSLHLHLRPLVDGQGRTGSCQGCHPAHRWDRSLKGYPLTPDGRNAYSGEPGSSGDDCRDASGGCFVNRDVHSNRNKDRDGAETPEHLNAVGAWLKEKEVGVGEVAAQAQVDKVFGQEGRRGTPSPEEREMSESELEQEERQFRKFPRNDGPIEGCHGHARLTGPCGETMEFWLVVRDGEIKKASFVSDGCATSHACGSMAAILAESETVEDAASIGQQRVLEALGGLPSESEHCALLAANALQAACEDCLGRECS